MLPPSAAPYGAVHAITPRLSRPPRRGVLVVCLVVCLVLATVCLFAPYGQAAERIVVPPFGQSVGDGGSADRARGLTPDNAGPPPEPDVDSEPDEAKESKRAGDRARQQDSGKDSGKTPTAPAGTTSSSSTSSGGTSAAPANLQLFGTVEFKRPLNSLPVWLDMLARDAKNPVFAPGSKLNSSTEWDDFKAKTQKLSLMEQLKAVNLFWNKWPYREDREVYGKPDYWAAPYEFRKNSGDCEDYAIVKYRTLRELGVPAEDMRIVVLMETIRNLAHAVLVVYTGGDAFVLDNLSNNVLSHSRYRNYLPQFSVNEQTRWAHIKPSNKKKK